VFEVSYFDIKENNSGKYEVDSIVLCHKKNRILTFMESGSFKGLFFYRPLLSKMALLPMKLF